jgi:hypothetical protein
MRKEGLLRIPLDVIVWVLALVSFVDLVRPYVGSLMYYALVFLGVSAVCAFVVYRLRKPPIHRAYNLSPVNKELICTKVHTKLIVEPTRSALDTRIDYVFLQEPSARNLFDLLEPSSSGVKVSYSSKDADEINREPAKEGGETVYWRPKKRITLYEDYPHRYEASPVGKYDDDWNAWYYNSTRLTGRIAIEIQSYRPIDDFSCFVTGKRFKDHERLLRCLVLPQRKPQQSFTSSRAQSSLTVEVVNPKPANHCWVLWSHGCSLQEKWVELATAKLAKLAKTRVRKYFARDYYKLKGLLVTARDLKSSTVPEIKIAMSS